ncbi:multidrug resistance protein [Desulfurispirillum indicum S5]|uniref:Multidrug resistance protein n=1 Tax=Desulfurispirillum indicum (strain ATCC BAA-1389 / DSM 22839 / S5) TaxID=653733 RepID=E6W1A7_DESIS|nr:multidrug resistance protein [Desulfurispirillum indicum S5]
MPLAESLLVTITGAMVVWTLNAMISHRRMRSWLRAALIADFILLLRVTTE